MRLWGGEEAAVSHCYPLESLIAWGTLRNFGDALGEKLIELRDLPAELTAKAGLLTLVK